MKKISISKIWIDEANNSWELEYTHSESIDSRLPDALTGQIINYFNLKNLCWKKPEQETGSVPLPDSEVQKSIMVSINQLKANAVEMLRSIE